MRPIPARLLPHTVTVVTDSGGDGWETPRIQSESKLTNVRIEMLPTRKISNDNTEIDMSATLFYDCYSSRPQNFRFKHGQQIVFCGNTYTVKSIEPLYAYNKLHHIEVRLV